MECTRTTQDWPQPTHRTALSKQMLFLFWSCTWLCVGEQWPPLAVQKIQQLLTAFEYSQLSNHASFCCSHRQEGGRHLTTESSMTGYRQESTQLCRYAPELTAGPQDGKDGADRLLGSTCYFCICAPGWMRSVSVEPVCLHTSSHACYPGTHFCLLGQRQHELIHRCSLWIKELADLAYHICQGTTRKTGNT